jgi:hypothetical protein
MKYNYADIKAAAVSGDQTAINALGGWFERYGTSYWNGEYYDADQFRLFPVYEADQADVKIIGWELR